jgi:hypothetical protein
MSMLIGFRAAAPMHVHRLPAQQRKRATPMIDREKRAKAALTAFKRLGRITFVLVMFVIIVTGIVLLKSFVWIPHFANP